MGVCAPPLCPPPEHEERVLAPRLLQPLQLAPHALRVLRLGLAVAQEREVGLEQQHAALHSLRGARHAHSATAAVQRHAARAAEASLGHEVRDVLALAADDVANLGTGPQ